MTEPDTDDDDEAKEQMLTALAAWFWVTLALAVGTLAAAALFRDTAMGSLGTLFTGMVLGFAWEHDKQMKDRQ